MKWYPYPQNKPGAIGWYLLTVSSSLGTIVIRAHYDETRDYPWKDAHGYVPSESAVAFGDLPEPYAEAD